MKRTFFIFLLVFTSIFNSLAQQNANISKLKVALLYHYGEKIIWNDENKFQSFNIAYLGDDPAILNYLNKLKQEHKIKNHQIKIHQLLKPSQIDYSNIQMIFVAEKYNPVLKSIFKEIGNNSTLLVSENAEDKKIVMINFYVGSDNKLKFEINKSNLIINGMHVLPELMFYGGTEIDIADIYQQARDEMESALDSLDQEKNKVEIFKKEIYRLKDDITDKELELQSKEKEIKQRTNTIREQLTKIGSQHKHLDEINSRLYIIGNDIKVKESEIIKKETLLNSKEDEISIKQKELQSVDQRIALQKKRIKDQEDKILEQGDQLNKSNLKIQQQQTILITTGIFTSVVLILIVLTYKAYKAKNSAYIQLERQTEQIRDQKEELQSQRDKLNETNQQIYDQKVQLEKTLHELKEAQAMLVHSEKLASLGQVTAGIAHEINTPLGAINASADNINIFNTKFIDKFTDLIKILTPENVPLFIEMLSYKHTNSNSLTTKEKRQLKREIRIDLEENNIQETDEYTHFLTELGIYNNWKKYSELIFHKDAKLFLECAYYLNQLFFNSQNIQLAVHKASKVVFALKKYSRKEDSEYKVETPLGENIETVLMIYHNHLKHMEINIELPQKEVRIMAFPDELSQVWTNLIYNALQAMEFKGRLDIYYKLDEASKQVTIFMKDYGVGIPENIQDKIFAPFFSTKPAGEGSGLGLDIVRKIVDKHEGAISFTSKQNEGTIFSVILPTL